MPAAVVPPGHYFDAQNEKQRKRQIRAALAEREKSRGHLKCAACGALVTYRESGILMRGMHAHWFTNPSGYSFYVGCFENAPGCGHIGPETEEQSWFPGYAWTIALCANCKVHLGWRFRSPESGFYGLILNRLVSSSPD